MRPRLIAIFVILVLAPLAMLAWLGFRLAADERNQIADRFRQLSLQSLAETRSLAERALQERVARLDDRFTPELSPVEIRQRLRGSPWVEQVFVLGQDCGREFPPVGGPLSGREQEFIGRAKSIWPDMVALCRGHQVQGGGLSADDASGGGADRTRHDGWYVWRWGGTGLELIHWRRPDGGGLVGMELSTIRLLADLIAVLPHAGPGAPGSQTGRTALVDASGQVIYQWGDQTPQVDEQHLVGLALAPPLDFWSLRFYPAGGAAEEALGGSVTLSLVAVLVLAGLALVGLAIYFFRQQARAMGEARQRVSFVNRVSHELRTPLTNIRLYAELLQDRLAAEDEKTVRQLGVIVSESGRLGRLIGNVLAFARAQRGELRLRMSVACVDDLVARVIEQFELALGDRQLAVHFEAGAPAAVRLDADALEQMLANLLGNVEKYAAAGGRVDISTSQDEQRTTIVIADRGPGIPSQLAERVFDPFYRLSDKLTEGASGSGLGLAIARDLARLHGGDLRLLPTELGACFELTLHTPPGRSGGVS